MRTINEIKYHRRSIDKILTVAACAGTVGLSVAALTLATYTIQQLLKLWS